MKRCQRESNETSGVGVVDGVVGAAAAAAAAATISSDTVQVFIFDASEATGPATRTSSMSDLDVAPTILVSGDALRTPIPGISGCIEANH